MPASQCPACRRHLLVRQAGGGWGHVTLARAAGRPRPRGPGSPGWARVGGGASLAAQVVVRPRRSRRAAPGLPEWNLCSCPIIALTFLLSSARLPLGQPSRETFARYPIPPVRIRRMIILIGIRANCSGGKVLLI